MQLLAETERKCLSCAFAGYAMQEVHRLHRTKRLLGLNAFQRHQKFVAGQLKGICRVTWLHPTLCCWVRIATSLKTFFKSSMWLPADYIKFYRGKLPENQQDTKSDQDVLREHYRQVLESPPSAVALGAHTVPVFKHSTASKSGLACTHQPFPAVLQIHTRRGR